MKTKRQILADGFALFAVPAIPNNILDGYLTDTDGQGVKILQNWLTENRKVSIKDWCTAISIIEVVEHLYQVASNEMIDKTIIALKGEFVIITNFGQSNPVGSFTLNKQYQLARDLNDNDFSVVADDNGRANGWDNWMKLGIELKKA